MTTPLNDEQREALWEKVADVRDASPRTPDDADTWDIVNAIESVVADLLAAEREQVDRLAVDGISLPDEDHLFSFLDEHLNANGEQPEIVGYDRDRRAFFAWLDEVGGDDVGLRVCVLGPHEGRAEVSAPGKIEAPGQGEVSSLRYPVVIYPPAELIAHAPADLAAERERGDQAEREAADLLAALEEKATCACGHGVVCQECALVDRERADREKARADAAGAEVQRARSEMGQWRRLAHERQARADALIRSIRAWVRHGEAVPPNVTTYDRWLVHAELLALLPDDTKEAEHHPRCYQTVGGIPDDLPPDTCDCKVWRLIDGTKEAERGGV